MNQIKCAELLSILVQTNQERLTAMSESESTLSREEEKWSPKEVIGHLVDSAINNYSRFAGTEDTDELRFSGYLQEEWVLRGKYKEMAWNDLVILWAKLNLKLSILIEGIPENIYCRRRAKHNLNKIA